MYSILLNKRLIYQAIKKGALFGNVIGLKKIFIKQTNKNKKVLLFIALHESLNLILYIIYEINK